MQRRAPSHTADNLTALCSHPRPFGRPCTLRARDGTRFWPDSCSLAAPTPTLSPRCARRDAAPPTPPHVRTLTRTPARDPCRRRGQWDVMPLHCAEGTAAEREAQGRAAQQPSGGDSAQPPKPSTGRCLATAGGGPRRTRPGSAPIASAAAAPAPTPEGGVAAADTSRQEQNGGERARHSDAPPSVPASQCPGGGAGDTPAASSCTRPGAEPSQARDQVLQLLGAHGGRRTWRRDAAVTPGAAPAVQPAVNTPGSFLFST